jgi:hypothetical protein
MGGVDDLFHIKEYFRKFVGFHIFGLTGHPLEKGGCLDGTVIDRTY